MCATNVEEAMNYASSEGPFGFFILDCDMREADPNALGLNLLDFTGNRPIIFLGNEAIITDRISQELYQHNEYNDRVLKPSNRDDFAADFITKIDHALTWAKEEEFEQSLEEVDPDEYIQMRLKSFFLYTTFPYDIYLAITSKTYIKIISADKPYSLSTLTTYARKNVKYLYIKKDDQLKYLEKEATKCLKGVRAIDPVHKDVYILLLRSITILHQYILAIGVSPSVLTLANATSDLIIEHYKRSGSIGKILAHYPTTYEGIASKSLLTAFLAEGIAWKLGWESITTKKKLAICAILHDITLPEEGMAMINSADSPYLSGYTEEEIQAFIQHPITSAEFAKQFTTFPDIDYIIASHHETPNRKGFPNRPSSSKLTQICSVFNSAQYVAAEIDGKDINNQLLLKTLKSMMRDYNFGAFKDILKILKSNLKIS